MRKLSTLIDRMAGLAQPRLPAGRLERINQALRRRLDDAVEDVFNQACLKGDLDTAGQLLAVLERMHSRRQAEFGRERRINDDAIVRGREELDRRLRVRALPPPLRIP